MIKKRGRSDSGSNNDSHKKYKKDSPVECTLPSSPTSTDHQISLQPSEDEKSTDESMGIVNTRGKTPRPNNRAIQEILSQADPASPPRPKGSSIQREDRGFFTKNGFQPTPPKTSRKPGH